MYGEDFMSDDYYESEGSGVEVKLYEYEGDFRNQASKTFHSTDGALKLDSVLSVFEKVLLEFGFGVEGKTLQLVDYKGGGKRKTGLTKYDETQEF